MLPIYKHKSGALKRKIQKGKLEKEAKGLQTIAKFIKFEEKAEASKDQNYAVSVPTTTSSELNPSGSEASESQSSEHQVNAEEIVTTDRDSSALGQDVDLSMNSDDNSYACDDPGTWPSVISDSLRQQIVSSYAGFSALQTRSKSFPKDLLGRHFQETLLYMKTAVKRTRQQFPSEWLMWSESKNTIHCFPCSIFKSNVSQLAKEGFSPQQTPYKKLYRYLPLHENSFEHRKHYLAWKTLRTSLKGHGIDSNLQQMIHCEASKWKAILQRILDTTLFLGSRGLAFQGETTQIGDVHNGNFLGIMELIGKYDDVTREHLAKVKENQLKDKSMRGQAHYLSWYSQNEFISLCGEKLLKTILNEREEAIFYGIIVDSTPDVSHQEQNVLILRYVFQNKETNSFEICERFIEFKNFSRKTGEAITDEILSTLETLQVPLADCRAQGYDNGSNMRGHIAGVQARILEKNEFAIFSPCGAHSLNRVGVNAAKLNHDVLTFFGNIESLYSLFSSSPGRWELLKQHVPLSLKSLSETRWSERLQAVRPIVKYYPSILKVLDLLLEDTVTTLSPLARNTVLGLKKYFGSFRGLLMSSFWYKVLSVIDQKNIIIQSKGVSLNVQTQLIKDLLDEMQKLRDSWEIILQESKVVAEAVGISSHFVIRRRPARIPNADENTLEEELQLEATNEFKSSVIFPVLDFVMADLKTRFAGSELICDLFSPILNFMDLDSNQLKIKTKSLVSKYPKDLAEADVLDEEILHMKSVHSTVFDSEKDPLKLLNSIYEKKLEAIFVNLCTGIKLFCTIPVTVSTAERSFSRLANSLKTWQRSTTGQNRLNHLAILTIESELAKNVDFSDVIEHFSQKKARKVYSLV